MWRLARNCVPTRARLIEKGINIIDQCPWCEHASETAEHLLFFCEKSKMVWQNIGHWHQLHPFQLQQVIFAKMFSILSILPQEQQCIFAVTCWSIWRSRNVTIWENTRERVANIVQRGKCLLEEWRAVRIGPVQRENPPQPTVNRHPWQRPPRGFVKCNVDASFSKPLNKVGIGMCLRDEFGMYMGAKTMWFQPLMDVRIGEVVGLLSVIERVQELEFKQVVFSLDAKSIVDSFNMCTHDRTELGSILSNCRSMISSLCNNSYVEFIRREANMIAHNLSKAAMYNANSQVYHDIPMCIDPLISNYMN
jgi:hypothetical protein